MAKLYIVSLTDAERLLLQGTIKTGTASARTITSPLLAFIPIQTRSHEHADQRSGQHAEAGSFSLKTLIVCRVEAKSEGSQGTHGSW